MTRDEKLQAIEDMGIDVSINGYCPCYYGLKDFCEDGRSNDVCPDCWIKALEDGGDNV